MMMMVTVWIFLLRKLMKSIFLTIHLARPQRLLGESANDMKKVPIKRTGKEHLKTERKALSNVQHVLKHSSASTT